VQDLVDPPGVEQEPGGRSGGPCENTFLDPCADRLLRQTQQLGSDARPERRCPRQVLLDEFEQRRPSFVLLGERPRHAFQRLDALDQIERPVRLVREALAAMVRASAARGTGDRHLVSAGVVDVSSDTATGRAYVQVVSVTDEGVRHVAFGRYDDTFARDGGRWRIRSRRFTPFTSGSAGG
jgi:hypothetical protein